MVLRDNGKKEVATSVPHLELTSLNRVSNAVYSKILFLAGTPGESELLCDMAIGTVTS